MSLHTVDSEQIPLYQFFRHLIAESLRWDGTGGMEQRFDWAFPKPQ